MKKVLTITVFVMLALVGMAKQRTQQELQLAAQNFFLGENSNIRKNFSDIAVKMILKDTQLTIFDSGNGKCVVVSNDDAFNPIIGYTETSISESEMAPAFKWWLESINKSMTEILAGQSIPVKVEKSSAYREAVPELLTTKWSQESPYSDLSPTYTRNTQTYHYVTGCVATAMAQIMYYHKYPAKGKGYNRWTYYPNGSSNPGTTIRVSFTNTYDWDNMLPTYARNNYDEVQAKAIATLMKDCGGSVSMQYSESGSGAYPNDACLALRKNFQYHEAIKLYSRFVCPVNKWMDMVYRELNDNCPILYGGATKDGAGHEFVLDGYDKDGLVHVNWGWNGTNNGYFNIALLNSNQGSFTEGQNMVIVRLPNDERFNEVYHSIWGTDTGLNLTLSGDEVSMENFTAYNMDVDNFTGYVQLVARNLATGMDYTLTDMDAVSDVAYGNGLRISLSADLSQLADGDYRLYMASLSTKPTSAELEWQPILGNEKVTNNYLLSKNNGKSSLSKGDVNWTTGISQVSTSASQSSPYTYIYNMQGQEIYKAPTASFRLSDVPAHGILIVKQGNIVKKIVK